jgi:hypothetical protein
VDVVMWAGLVGGGAQVGVGSAGCQGFPVMAWRIAVMTLTPSDSFRFRTVSRDGNERGGDPDDRALHLWVGRFRLGRPTHTHTMNAPAGNSRRALASLSPPLPTPSRRSRRPSPVFDFLNRTVDQNRTANAAALIKPPPAASPRSSGAETLSGTRLACLSDTE